MFSRVKKCFEKFDKPTSLYRMLSSTSNVSQVISVIESQHFADTSKITVTSIPDHNFSNLIAHYQSVLDTIQLSSSLPWWAVLVGSGLFLRTFLLPCNIWYEKRMIKNIPHKAVMFNLTKEINNARMRTDHVLCFTKMEEKAYYKKKNNYNWRKSENWFLVPTFSVMFISFMSIRGLTELPYQPLFSSSFFWIPNLCEPDPYFILPALNALATVYVLKTGIDSGESPISKFLSSYKNLFIIMAIMGSCQSFFPSALVLYWFSSNLAGLAVIRPFLCNDKSRKIVGLMPIKEKRDTLEQFQPIKSFSNDLSSNYKGAREVGLNKDILQREEKLAELENGAKDNELKIKEIKKLLQGIEKTNDDIGVPIHTKELKKSLNDIELSLQVNKEEVKKLREEACR